LLFCTAFIGKIFIEGEFFIEQILSRALEGRGELYYIMVIREILLLRNLQLYQPSKEIELVDLDSIKVFVHDPHSKETN